MWYCGLIESPRGAATDHPMAKARSVAQFQQTFHDEAACASFLFERRWPDGFVCPGCGARRAAALRSRAYTFECLDCGRQTSITAGTAMHRSKLPLTTWFWAVISAVSDASIPQRLPSCYGRLVAAQRVR